MEHIHTFDRRDTVHTRCLECKRLVNDPGKMPYPVKQTTVEELVRFMNRLAESVGVYNTDPKKGPVYCCTVGNFGR